MEYHCPLELLLMDYDNECIPSVPSPTAFIIGRGKISPGAQQWLISFRTAERPTWNDIHVHLIRAGSVANFAGGLRGYGGT